MSDGYEVVANYVINRKALEITEVPQCDSGCGRCSEAEGLRREVDRLTNIAQGYYNKLGEWQQQTGYSCPSSAGRWLRLATAKALHATRDKEALAQIRPAVLWFAEQMEVRLSQNDYKEDMPRPTMEESLTALRKHFYALLENCQIDQENDPLQQKWHAAHIANWLLLLLGKDVNERSQPSGESAKQRFTG